MGYVYDDGCCPHSAIHECAPCPPATPPLDVERLARALRAMADWRTGDWGQEWYPVGEKADVYAAAIAVAYEEEGA